MAFPVALVPAILEFVKYLFPKKATALQKAIDHLVSVGLNIQAFKAARAKIDLSVDKNAAETDPAKRECVVLEPEEAAALDFAMDHLAEMLGSVKGALNL